MGAGLSKTQRNRRIYTRLQSIKRELIRAGVPTLYKGGQLFLNDIANIGGGFNVSYIWLDASNAEGAAIPQIRIQPPNPILHSEDFGGRWVATKNGTFEQGIARLKELFKVQPKLDNITVCSTPSTIFASTL